MDLPKTDRRGDQQFLCYNGEVYIPCGMVRGSVGWSRRSWMVVVVLVAIVTSCQHSTHSPPHEQLLEELDMGGVPSTLSPIATDHPPCKQTLTAEVVVLIAIVVTQCWHSICSPPHKQLLKELDVGGVPSALSLMLTAVVVVLIAIVIT